MSPNKLHLAIYLKLKIQIKPTIPLKRVVMYPDNIIPEPY